MMAVYKAPGRKAEPREIDNTLEELQGIAGGYIETFRIAQDAVVICNKEGKLLGIEPNVLFLGELFVGPIIVAGVDWDEFCSISPENVAFIMRGLNKAGGF